LGLTLLLDGKPFNVEMGKSIKLSGSFENPTVQVQAAATRLFTYGGISMEYPSYFQWEADVADPDVQIWTISGADSVLMYLVFSQAVTLDFFTSSLAKEFGEENTKISPVGYSLGGVNFVGQRVHAAIGEAFITQDVLVIPGPSGAERLLVLQDVDPKMHPESEEARVVMELLSKTFAVKKFK